jgi:hypothetical protein
VCRFNIILTGNKYERAGKKIGWRYLRTGCWEEYLDLRSRKWQEAGEDCIMRSFITYTLHQIFQGNQIKVLLISHYNKLMKTICFLNRQRAPSHDWCVNANGSKKKKKKKRIRVSVAVYEGVSKSFRTVRLERELQMVQISATRCSCIAISWVSLVSFVAITLCVASQRMIIIIVIYFFIDSVRKLLDTPSYVILKVLRLSWRWCFQLWSRVVFW